AVNDKSAKDLLGETFKRQLYMDGGYQTISFLCSKCDDISVTEAIESLGLEDEVQPFFDRVIQLQNRRKELMENVKDGKAIVKILSQELKELRKEKASYETMWKQAKAGGAVYAPESESIVIPEEPVERSTDSRETSFRSRGKVTSYCNRNEKTIDLVESDGNEYIESNVSDNFGSDYSEFEEEENREAQVGDEDENMKEENTPHGNDDKRRKISGPIIIDDDYNHLRASSAWFNTSKTILIDGDT